MIFNIVYELFLQALTSAQATCNKLTSEQVTINISKYNRNNKK